MPFIDRVIIVDWSSELSLEIKGTKAEIIRVWNKPFFNQPKAQNLGIRYLDTDFIFAIDCDVAIQAYEQVYSRNPGFVNLLAPHIKSGCFITKSSNEMSDGALTGTMIFEKSAWEKVGGYPENVIGWGYQDIGFIDCLRAAGYQEKNLFNENYLFHVPHDNTKRTENYSFKTQDKWFTMLVNRFITKNTDYLKQKQQKQVCSVVDIMEERVLYI